MFLSRQELSSFSLPLPLCLLGERQGLFGLGSVVVATTLRLAMRATETDGEFWIEVGREAGSERETRALADRWRELLENEAPRGRHELNGLTLAVDPRPGGELLPAEAILRSPMFAVGAICAVRAFRGEVEEVGAEDVAMRASELLSALESGGIANRHRYYSLALVCIQGGALYVERGAGSISLQKLVPPQSLLLAMRTGLGPMSSQAPWEAKISESLRKTGVTASQLVAAGEEDLGRFFRLASKKLDESETAILYDLLRVHQLVLELVERLDEPVFDYDLLAEMCDEESELLEQDFRFQSIGYGSVRKRAVEAGALGAKSTVGPGNYPCLLIIAPGRRESVREALAARFENLLLVPADLDPDGLRPD